MVPDRREHSRIRTDKRLVIRIRQLDLEMVVTDASWGGLQCEGPYRFDRESTHLVDVRHRDGGVVGTVTTRVIYCNRVESTDAYRSGFAFLDTRQASTQETILAIIAAATAPDERPLQSSSAEGTRGAPRARRSA